MDKRSKYWFVFVVVSLGIGLFFILRYSNTSLPMKRIRIQHIDTSLVFRVQMMPPSQTVYGLNLEFSGSLEGTILVTLNEDGQNEIFQIKLNEKNIRDKYTFDWYVPYCELKIIPLTYKSGDVLIKYRFLSTGVK